MNRDDILKKSREENKFLDEREQREVGNSFGYGGLIVILLCGVFSVMKALQGQRFYEFGVIIFGYISAYTWRSYVITKKSIYLIQAIACSFSAILGFVAYFIMR